MTLTEILAAQLLDPFRLGLIVALVITMNRTREATGTVLPLVFGVIFVAAIVPATMPATGGQPFWRLFATGLVANAVLLAVVLGVWSLYLRLRR